LLELAHESIEFLLRLGEALPGLSRVGELLLELLSQFGVPIL